MRDYEEIKIVESAKTTEKKKKKKKLWFILLPFMPFIAVFLAITVGVLTLFGFVGNKFNLINFDDKQTTIDFNQEFIDDEEIDFGEIGDANGKDLKEILKNWATNGGTKMKQKSVINLLLIGSDASSTDPNRANVMEKGNTDVMMLVSINPAKKTIKLVSFMRDSYTYMDQFDRYAKLNAACANGGPGYLVETIENNYKIKIDGYVMVDFDSFIQVIDVLGGVKVDVPEYVAEHLTRDSKGKYFPRGKQVLLNGEEALKFSRVRYTDADGDISRVARQRQVINALIKRCKTATLGEINAVSDVILANIRTNISRKAILGYATKAITDGWADYELTEVTMPTADARYGYSSRATSWIWVVDYPLVAQKLQMELYGETNIHLEEDRKTAITVVGGYVTKN